MSERLAAPQADRFHKTGRQLRTKMYWQNMKLKIIVGLVRPAPALCSSLLPLAWWDLETQPGVAGQVILVLIFVIFCLVCFSGGNCLKH